MEITINARQLIAIIWTAIAVVIALIVDFGMALWPSGASTAASPWWFTVVVFFGVFLVITLPVYLLLALWGITAYPDTE